MITAFAAPPPRRARNDEGRNISSAAAAGSVRRFETKELVAPCLLTNDLSSIVRLRVRSPRYHAASRGGPGHAVALAGFRILVKRKQGHLSHAADPHGLRSVRQNPPCPQRRLGSRRWRRHWGQRLDTGAVAAAGWAWAGGALAGHWWGRSRRTRTS